MDLWIGFLQYIATITEVTDTFIFRNCACIGNATLMHLNVGVAGCSLQTDENLCPIESLPRLKKLLVNKVITFG